jgi:hypothetical protein
MFEKNAQDGEQSALLNVITTLSHSPAHQDDLLHRSRGSSSLIFKVTPKRAHMA